MWFVSNFLNTLIIRYLRASDPTDRKSCQGAVFLVQGGAVAYKSEKQKTVLRAFTFTFLSRLCPRTLSICLLPRNTSKISLSSVIEKITRYGVSKYETSYAPSDVKKLSRTTLRCHYVRLRWMLYLTKDGDHKTERGDLES